MGTASFRLLIRNVDRFHEVTLSAGKTYVVGRDPVSDIHLDDPLVSGRPALLKVQAESVQLEDLGSSNGTLVDGTKVTGVLTLCSLQKVVLGSSCLILLPPEIGLQKEIVATESKGNEGSGNNPATSAERYKAGKEIARGGMGVVMEAEDLTIRRQVAMKVTLLGAASSRDATMRFAQEARILGRLDHPNIVPVHELGVDAKGQAFYTMKLVKGVTFQKVLDQIKAGNAEAIAKYPLSQLLTIFQKACDAVSFAHAKDIIHRDLKPDNIMLGEFGEVLVMDWGLAKVLGEESLGLEEATPTPKKVSGGTSEPPEQSPTTALGDPGSGGETDVFRTLEGRILGTPNFMAPEQAAGKAKEIDPRTDIYALGGILYAVLTLRPPVMGKELRVMLEMIRTGDIHPPTAYNENPALTKSDTANASGRAFAHCPGGKIPGALSAVAMKALALKPGDRYQALAELQKDITAYQSGFATSAELPGGYTLVKLWVRRHKTAAVALSSIAALVTAFSVVTIAMWAELRGTAQTFFEKSQSLVTQGKYEEALAPISYAIRLDGKNARYHHAQGNILQSLLRMGEAEKSYQ